jgi:hypothetical protein
MSQRSFAFELHILGFAIVLVRGVEAEIDVLVEVDVDVYTQLGTKFAYSVIGPIIFTVNVDEGPE